MEIAWERRTKRTQHISTCFLNEGFTLEKGMNIIGSPGLLRYTNTIGLPKCPSLGAPLFNKQRTFNKDVNMNSALTAVKIRQEIESLLLGLPAAARRKEVRRLESLARCPICKKLFSKSRKNKKICPNKACKETSMKARITRYQNKIKKELDI